MTENAIANVIARESGKESAREKESGKRTANATATERTTVGTDAPRIFCPRLRVPARTIAAGLKSKNSNVTEGNRRTRISSTK